MATVAHEAHRQKHRCARAADAAHRDKKALRLSHLCGWGDGGPCINQSVIPQPVG